MLSSDFNITYLFVFSEGPSNPYSASNLDSLAFPVRQVKYVAPCCTAPSFCFAAAWKDFQMYPPDLRFRPYVLDMAGILVFFCEVELSERAETLFPLLPSLLNTHPSLDLCLGDLDRSRHILKNTLVLGLRERLDLCLFSCSLSVNRILTRIPGCNCNILEVRARNFSGSFSFSLFSFSRLNFSAMIGSS
ncbi:hypothetical protein Tco_0452955 [Tanacetum coccineum]